MDFFNEMYGLTTHDCKPSSDQMQAIINHWHGKLLKQIQVHICSNVKTQYTFAARQ